MTLVLLALLSSVGYLGFAQVRGNTEGSSAGPTLSVAQLEARRLATASGEFPTSIVDDLLTLSDDALAFTSGASTSVDEVSVYRVSAATLTLTVRSGEECLVLVDRPFASATWALLSASEGVCAAEGLSAAALALDSGGSSSVPQEVSGG